MHGGHRAARDVQDRDLRDAPHAGDREERQACAVRGPRGALRLRRQVRDLTATPARHVADPELQVRAVFVRGVRELRAVGRPGGIGVEGLVVGEVDRPAVDRHHVDVANGRERDLLPIRGEHRPDDPAHLARRGRREVARSTGVLRPRHRQRGGELDRLRRPATDRALPNLAVGDVEEDGRRGPRRAEREDILARRQRLPIGLEAALPGGGDVIHELAPRPPGRRVDAATRAHHLALRAVSHVHRPHRLPVLARRREGNLLVIRRPGRHGVLRRPLRHLTDLAAPPLEDPDVVVAAQRIAALGGERELRAIVRPGGLAVVECSPRQWVQVRAVRRDRPEVVATVPIAEEGDPLAVG